MHHHPKRQLRRTLIRTLDTRLWSWKSQSAYAWLSKCQHCVHGSTQNSVPFCARHRVFSTDVRSPRREDYDTHYLQVCDCIDKSLQPQLESQACMERPDKHSNEDSQFVVLAGAYRSQSNYSLVLFFDDPTKMYMQLVLATLVNGALPFVQATYKLEGDRALIFERCDIISSLTAAVHVADYPNVKAVCKKPTQEIHLCNSSCCCTLSSVCSNYNHHLSWCLKKPLAAFKAARLIVPQKMQEVVLGDTRIALHIAIPFPLIPI